MEMQIKGAEILNEKERQIADKLLNEYYEKIKRQIKKDFTLKIDFKEYEKDGKNKKYSINGEIIFSGKNFSASAWDWDFARTVHKLMRKFITQIEHAFHSSEQK